MRRTPANFSIITLERIGHEQAEERQEARRATPAEGAREEDVAALEFLPTLAGAPAQRPLCGRRAARGLSLAGGLQADRDRRQGAAAETRQARGRFGCGARRLEPGR